MVPPPTFADIATTIGRYTDADVELWLLHLAFDVRNGNAEAATLSTLMEALTVDASFEELVRQVASLNIQPRTRRLPMPPESTCSRVMHADVFLRQHYSRATDALTGAELLEEMEIIPVDPSRCESKMRGRQPFFFVVPNDDYATALIGKTRKQHADTIRDTLGLSHFEADTPLVRLELPVEVIAALAPGAPTSIDALGHVPFSPSAASDGWGRTIDLASLGYAGKYQDGAREALADPVTASSCSRISPVGTTTYDHNPDHVRLLERARMRLV